MVPCWRVWGCLVHTGSWIWLAEPTGVFQRRKKTLPHADTKPTQAGRESKDVGPHLGWEQGMKSGKNKIARRTQNKTYGHGLLISWSWQRLTTAQKST